VYTAPEGVSSINFILTTKAGASDAEYYTLSGTRLSAYPTLSCISVRSGKKIVIR
jgi:hypothetical protein